MAEMNISNTLWNDTSEGRIAFAEQLFDRVIDWDSYYYINDEGVTVYPFRNKSVLDKFQARINDLFLNHYVDFQKFLNTKGIDGVIDTWKDVEEFLESISDSEATKLIAMIRDVQLASGQLNIRMSSSYPGAVEAVTTYDTLDISDSHIDEETGKINIIYNFE